MADITMSSTMKDLKNAANAIRKPALMDDVYEAIRKTLELYIKRDLTNRFRGRRFNPNYPRTKPSYQRRKAKKYGFKPLLVATGRLKVTVTRSARVQGRKQNMRIRVSSPEYGKYLRNRGFDFIQPQTTKEKKALKKYLLKTLSKLRVARQKRLQAGA